jgi:hypothetical protein
VGNLNLYTQQRGETKQLCLKDYGKIIEKSKKISFNQIHNIKKIPYDIIIRFLSEKLDDPEDIILKKSYK